MLFIYLLIYFCRNSWWILSAWASGILYRRVAAKCTTPFILFFLPSWWECSPALKPRSLINGLFEKESLVMNVFFLLRRKVKPVDGGWIPNIQELKAWEGMVEFETKVGDGTREEMQTERGEVRVKRLHSSFVVSEGESSGSTWWEAGLCPPSLPTDTMGLCVADLRNAERCQGWRMEAYRASRGQRQGEKVRVMDTEEHDNATARRSWFFVPALGLSMHVLPILCGFLCHFKKKHRF